MRKPARNQPTFTFLHSEAEALDRNAASSVLNPEQVEDPLVRRSLRALELRGSIVTADSLTENPLVRVIQKERGQLKRVVQMFAFGEKATSRTMQDTAVSILQRFDAMPDLELGTALHELGLTGSTESSPEGYGPYRYTLFIFRRAYQAWQKRTGNG
jgi:hypothetical protein